MRCIYDFIALLGLCGNDFCPQSPSLKFSDSKHEIKQGMSNSVDNLFALYSEQDFVKNGEYLVESNGRLNIHRMQSILEKIGTAETRWFKQFKTSTDLVSTVPSADLKISGYRDRWMRNKFGLDMTQSNLNSIVKSYMKILSWYVLLYINGLSDASSSYKSLTASWTHYYQYLYAPLASDVGSVKLPKYFTFNEYSEPITAIEQQMLVFSKDSILEIMGPKYFCIADSLPEMYPELNTIDIDYELAENKSYKGILHLPPIDYLVVREKLRNL